MTTFFGADRDTSTSCQIGTVSAVTFKMRYEYCRYVRMVRRLLLQSIRCNVRPSFSELSITAMCSWARSALAIGWHLDRQ